jgi:hypothetical protein
MNRPPMMERMKRALSWLRQQPLDDELSIEIAADYVATSDHDSVDAWLSALDAADSKPEAG